MDKMTPLEDFMELVKEKTKAAIFHGETGRSILKRLQKRLWKPIYRALSMKDAVSWAINWQETGDIVLLSPGLLKL